MNKVKYVLIVVISLFLLTGCGKEWPLNENTNGVPEPSFKKVEYINVTNKETTAMYTNVTKSESKKYVIKLQNNGFEEDVRINEFAGNYYFKATNIKTNVTVTYDRVPTGIVVITAKKNK